jgi:RNA polymerase sigma-70 factor (ECF subfamily)
MDDEQRLSRIATQWSIVRRAHEDTGEDQQSAQQVLLDRYGGAVRRYLIASLRDVDAAEEVFQDFALRFLRRDFQSANPEQGKFRGFLKTVIGRMVVDYHRRRQRRNRHEVHVQEDLPAVANDVDTEAVDFSVSWREELLARAWEQLREVESREGRPYYTVLRCRVEQPDTKSQELAALLSERLGKPLTAGNVRVLVHRARDRFAEFLLAEVAGSVDAESLDHLEQELIELRLHDYCREPLDRMRARRESTGEA